MTQNDHLKLSLIMKLSLGQINKLEVAKILGKKIRTVERYLSEYRKKGPKFVIHGNKNRTPHNATPSEVKNIIITTFKDVYYDCNFTHASELLLTNSGLIVNPKTLGNWLRGESLSKHRKRRSSKAKKSRQRMKQTGIMIQFDGSHHRWFGNEESCLIGGIDDADSAIPWGEFFDSESTLDCMKVLRKIVETKGIFSILYTDQAGLFGDNKRANFSQIKRALEELDIQVITTPSAEAKGRIERLWGTLQDRLIPELRINNITTKKDATKYLNEIFIPETFKKKFKVEPLVKTTAYKPLPDDIELNEIFCIKEFRVVKRDHTFTYENKVYQIIDNIKNSIHKQKIQIRIYPDRSMKYSLQIKF